MRKRTFQSSFYVTLTFRILTETKHQKTETAAWSRKECQLIWHLFISITNVTLELLWTLKIRLLYSMILKCQKGMVPETLKRLR